MRFLSLSSLVLEHWKIRMRKIRTHGSKARRASLLQKITRASRRNRRRSLQRVKMTSERQWRRLLFTVVAALRSGSVACQLTEAGSHLGGVRQRCRVSCTGVNLRFVKYLSRRVTRPGCSQAMHKTEEKRKCHVSVHHLFALFNAIGRVLLL